MDNSAQQLSRLYEGCRSYRRFQQKAVPQELLKELTETARKRSSARNAQPLRYLVVSSPEIVRRVQPCLHWAASLPKEIGTPHEDEQPTAFIVVINPENATVLTGVDIGISLDTMAITAWQQGVGSCILYAVDRPELSEILPVPDGFVIGPVLALGYPRNTSVIVDEDAEHGLSYYVDADRNYYVPKRPAKEVIRYL